MDSPYKTQTLSFLWCELMEQIVEQTFKLPMVWDAVTLMWRHCNVRDATRLTLLFSLLFEQLTMKLHLKDITMTSWKARWRLKSPAFRVFTFRHRSKKTSKLRATGLCEGNSPVTGEFPSQRASNAENVSVWWCHHENRNASHWWLSKLVFNGRSWKQF